MMIEWSASSTCSTVFTDPGSRILWFGLFFLRFGFIDFGSVCFIHDVGLGVGLWTGCIIV